MNAQLSRVSQEGVVLIESLLAILIFAVGVLALVGLQATAIQESEANRQRTEAAFLANQIVAEMWAGNPNNLAASAGTYDSVESPWGRRALEVLPSGSVQVVVNGGAVTVTVNWFPPRRDPNTPRVYVQTTRIVSGG
jgi:type IV pilus assembly protein PilV